MTKGKRMRFREVRRLREFERDLKKLLKKYSTLEEDLAILVSTQLAAFHKLGLDNGGVFRIDDLGEIIVPVYKVKKFACRSLKGKGVRTGLRLIYAWFEADDRIELVEIYLKADKSTEDRKRILKYYRMEQ